MARTKIQFNDEHRNRVKELVDCGKNFDEIVESFCEEFFKVSRSSIVKLIKEMGIDKRDGRKDNKRDLVYDIEPIKIIKLWADGYSFSQIAQKLGVELNAIERVVEREKMTYNKTIKPYKENQFYNQDVIDLRRMRKCLEDVIRDRYLKGMNEKLSEFNTSIITNYELEFDGKKFIVDFYCPEINMGFVCSSMDDLFVDNNKMSWSSANRWVRFINKHCNVDVNTIPKWVNGKRYEVQFEKYSDPVSFELNYVPKTKIYKYDGLYVNTYLFRPDLYDMTECIFRMLNSIVDTIIQIMTKGEHRMNVDFDETSIEKGWQEVEVEIEQKGYMGIFDDIMREARKRGEENYGKEIGKKTKWTSKGVKVK